MSHLGLRSIVAGFAMLAMGFAADHADARSLNDILKAGEIRIGVNPATPPQAEYNDQNEIDGFDPDLAKVVAGKLGVKLTLVPVSSPDRIPFVAADKVDIVMGAMSRTSERAKVIDFSAPIHSENYGVLTLEAKPYTKLSDLNDEAVRRLCPRPRCSCSKTTTTATGRSCRAAATPRSMSSTMPPTG